MKFIRKEEIEKICFEEILGIWKNQPVSFLDGMIEVSEQQKCQNEETIQELMMQWRKLSKTFPTQRKRQLGWKLEMDKMLEGFLEKEQILKIRENMTQEMFEDFQSETKRFVRKTRRFDQELSTENIWQALRNYFIYAVIGDLQGQPQDCKEAPFSYSLLYPYTDNYIDDKKHTPQQKQDYNFMISQVLKDMPVEARGKLEEKTHQLLFIVMDSYSGDKRKEIQNLLIWMLEAQKESICQQTGERKLTEEEVLRISVYKGGLSVLIDYFFATEELNKEEISFYLKFGFLLQLADDLQDIKEDQISGSRTLAVLCAEEGRLEEFVNRLLHFIRDVFETFSPVNSNLKNFMKEHCYSLVMSAAVSNRKYLSKDYMDKIEQFFIVHIEYLSKRQKQMEQNKGSSEKAEEYLLQMMDIMTEEG